ncbi:uncharacterized protein LOC124943177 [Impatiens glandulifera]|uniref:uncharacterized protein LOC124943177 n=1 Tax=Impatiens glandulifera TaxID=253017 RepID=UPI001FB0EAC4|nr:uncharacterized protein LOC124943177 [Impatiens glandulifera]
MSFSPLHFSPFCKLNSLLLNPNSRFKMGNFNIISSIILIFLLSLTLSPSSASTIYDVLRYHNLPIGLLPKGVTNFTVNSSTGRFQVLLPSACSAQFESQVRYDFNVSGTIRSGRIGNLSGMLAQDLFLWFPVKDIRVDVPDSGLIYFDVGVVRKQFPQSLFETPRDCTAEDPDSPPPDLLMFKDGDRIIKNKMKNRYRPKKELDVKHVSMAAS